ncbi:MAG: hypothetical protein FJ078_07900 [Cyanobacteria bacterium K_DeepCast_35m_m2_155]|nr:hypothetical protein [Cyanobacteria bacterium K_DeepCast_35m_m2_155]
MASSPAFPIPTPSPLAAGPAESLVASLCREMAQLRERARLLIADQARCREDRLVCRLRQELQQLQRRRQELQACVRQLRRSGGLRDNLALAFLEELTRRPLPC